MTAKPTDPNEIITLKIALSSGAVVDVLVPFVVAREATKTWKESFTTGEPGPRDIVNVEVNGVGYAVAFKANQIDGLSYNL